MSNQMPEIPSELNWVEGRHKCSMPTVFKELQLGVQGDVDAVNALIIKGIMMRFSFVVSGKRFSVVCEVNYDPSGSVDFLLSGDEIIISEDGVEKLRACLTLNNSGKCTLRIGDEEMEQWQLRRRALESLFFSNNNRGRYL
jgi:hypothetical protein